MTLLKINRLLPIYISIVPLKFEVDIQSQSKVRVRKPKNPIWPPGGHFESDIAENQWASAYGHHQHAYEIWNWNSKANLTYAPETMSSTDRRTDGQTDRRTDGQTDKVNPVYPPSNFVGRGYNEMLTQILVLPPKLLLGGPKFTFKTDNQYHSFSFYNQLLCQQPRSTSTK